MTSFDKIKTAAIARLEAGEDLEYILQDYADYEEELRPILEDVAGGSLGDLIRSPKSAEKPKVKAKRASNNWQMPAIAAIIIIVLFLGALLAAYLIQKSNTPTINIINIDPTTEPINVAPTAIPVTVDPITVQYAGNNCASLDNQQITSTRLINGQQAQSNTGIVYGDDKTIVGMPTGTPLPSSMPPVPEMGGGDVVEIPATGGGSSGEMTVSSGMPVPPMDGSAPVEEKIVVTSVASYDAVEKAAAPGDTSSTRDSVASDEAHSGEPTTSSESSGSAGVAVGAPVTNQVVLEPLRAGEIDDNADWDTYQEYRRNYLNQYGTYLVRDVDTTDRQVIQVVDSDGLPVLGACVQVYVGEYFVAASRTYATGLTLFFPNLRDETRYADTFRVVVSKGQASTETTMKRDNIGGVTNVTLPINPQQQTIPLDVLFLLDSTGSMSDEIAQLQENILNISAQIAALDANIDVRYSLVTYRDRTDEYVTRVYDFTNDVHVFQKDLASVVADGGGDYPESMNEGLDMALNAVQWRGEDAIKLVFLVADAPPHVDYQYDADYSLLMQTALARGIKIHPIASSGLQPEGEYIMRQIGEFTMGHFIFLTYDNGVPGTTGDERPDLKVGDPKDTQGVGDYSVSQLDELVMRLISDEINALSGK